MGVSSLLKWWIFALYFVVAIRPIGRIGYCIIDCLQAIIKILISRLYLELWVGFKRNSKWDSHSNQRNGKFVIYFSILCTRRHEWCGVCARMNMVQRYHTYLQAVESLIEGLIFHQIINCPIGAWHEVCCTTGCVDPQMDIKSGHPIY